MENGWMTFVTDVRQTYKHCSGKPETGSNGRTLCNELSAPMSDQHRWTLCLDGFQAFYRRSPIIVTIWNVVFANKSRKL